MRLAYLSDVFEALKNINLVFQGPNSSISDLIPKLEAFIRKLEIWIDYVESKQYGMFKFLSSLQSRDVEEAISLTASASTNKKRVNDR